MQTRKLWQSMIKAPQGAMVCRKTLGCHMPTQPSIPAGLLFCATHEAVYDTMQGRIKPHLEPMLSTSQNPGIHGLGNVAETECPCILTCHFVAAGCGRREHAFAALRDGLVGAKPIRDGILTRRTICAAGALARNLPPSFGVLHSPMFQYVAVKPGDWTARESARLATTPLSGRVGSPESTDTRNCGSGDGEIPIDRTPGRTGLRQPRIGTIFPRRHASPDACCEPRRRLAIWGLSAGIFVSRPTENDSPVRVRHRSHTPLIGEARLGSGRVRHRLAEADKSEQQNPISRDGCPGDGVVAPAATEIGLGEEDSRNNRVSSRPSLQWENRGVGRGDCANDVRIAGLSRCLMSWTGSEVSRQKQLPCDNRGAYPRYVVAMGTRVSVSRSRKGLWKPHTMRVTLVFDSCGFSNENRMRFDYDGWTLWVNRKDVETA